MGKRAARSAPVDVRALLAEAANTDAERALPLMITAWRAMPDATLAEAIVRVGKNACRGKQLPIEGEQERYATWLRLLRDDDPLMREAMLATLVGRTAGERIAGFLEHPDPRTTNKLVELSANAGDNVHYWGERGRPLLLAMAKCRDPRIVAHVDTVRNRWWPRNGHTKEGRDRRKQIEKLLDAVVAAFPLPHPELSGADRTIVAAIVDKLGGDVDPHDAAADAAMDATLRAAVYAHPEDDGPRAVYADWLQERGDVRGEMIALQLARKPGERASRRERELLDQHRRQWLDALAPRVFENRWVEFSRGFPAEIHVGDPSPDPAWSTLEVVHVDLPASNACPMPLLRRAEKIPLHRLVTLAEMTSAPPLEWLHAVHAVETTVDGRRLLDALGTLRLPRLKHLELSSPTWHTEPLLRPEHLEMLRAIGPLETLAITAPLGELRAWIDAVAPTTLPTFVLLYEPEYPPWRVTCTRDAQGRLSKIAAKSLNDRFACDERVQAICSMMTAMPEGSLTSIAMEVRHEAWKTVGQRRMIAAALDRHPGIDESGLKNYVRPTRDRVTGA